MIRRMLLGAALATMLAVAPALSQDQRPLPPAAPPPAPASSSDTPPQPITPALTASDLGSWLDGFMAGTLKQGKIAGAQVVVVKDGKLLFKKGYGYADVAARTPMNVDRSLMRIGSTSKLFTWTAVMQQVEAGKIDLNADISRYLDFKMKPLGNRPITMNDLMNHRGGFEEGIKDLMASDPKLLLSTERYLKDNLHPFLSTPGEVPAYSNYGAALAGYIVQRVSGEPFEAYVQRHILAPLKMAHTTFVQPLPAHLAGSMAKGYQQSDVAPTKFELVGTAPAGSASTTGADMANFMIAHLQDGRFGDGQLLRPETARLMHSPSEQGSQGFDTMAHGFFHGPRNGTLVIGHGGDTVVFHTDLNLLPEKGVGIFVSFNSRGEQNAAYGAREHLFDTFMDRYFPGPEVLTPPAIATAKTDAAALAGSYQSSRRVDTGFIRLFYMIQQDKIIANEDGTISVSSIENKKFREVAPNLWQQVDGLHRLMVTEVAGRRAIIDGRNPAGILQAVPPGRSAALFQLVAATSVLILLLTVLTWPIAAWVRRSYGLPFVATGRPALARRLTRIAAVADLIYLAGWYTVLAPILSLALDAYNAQLDGTIRALQIAAIVPIGGAAVGLWNAWTALRQPFGWGVRLRNVVVALALLAFLWIAYAGGLIGWTLKY